MNRPVAWIWLFGYLAEAALLPKMINCALRRARFVGMTGKYFRRRKESMKRFSIFLLTILVALSLGLAACQPATPEVVPTKAPATEAPVATEAPATEAPVTEAPATEAPAAEVALKITGAVA